MIRKATLCFDIFDKHLETIYATQNYSEDKVICSLKWINTRNRFSLHILESLLDYQRKYWFSGKETDLRPLTLKEFLTLYPIQYLEQSRLSRLISNLSVINPQNQLIELQSLFISRRRYHAYLIKEIVRIYPFSPPSIVHPSQYHCYGEWILRRTGVVPMKSGRRVNQDENNLKDKDIQQLLTQKSVHLSLRTICNCRKLLNIPNYKGKPDYQYEKDINFGDYIPLASESRKLLNKIPVAAGIYEFSVPIASGIDYQNHRSNVIYIGSSKNLRKRIASYLHNKLKNGLLSKFINNYDIFLRLFLTENYRITEKKLLGNFKNIYGELPKTNSLG